MSNLRERVESIIKVDEKSIKLPRSVKLEMSGICNHKCPFCVVPKQDTNSYPFMSSETFNMSVSEMYRLKIKELGLFHMGEGTLHPELLTMVEYAKKSFDNFFEMFITTNGTSLSQLKGLVAYNIKSIKFSLNGFDKESHKKQAGVNDYDLIMGNLEALIKYRNEINSTTQISASSIYYNKPEQDEFSKKVSELVDNFYYTQLYNHAGKVDNKPVRLTEDIRILPGLNSKPCYGLFNLGHIKVNGIVNMCRFGVDDEFNLGHISEGLDKLWFSEKAQEIRRKHLEDKIETCNECLNFINKA